MTIITARAHPARRAASALACPKRTFLNVTTPKFSAQAIAAWPRATGSRCIRVKTGEGDGYPVQANRIMRVNGENRELQGDVVDASQT